MRQLAAAVTVVASEAGGARAGLTATAVMSLTAQPPQLAVAVNSSASALPTIFDSQKFSVNVLACDHENIASRFAGIGGIKGEARFEGGDWRVGETGLPILANAAASFECTLAQVLPFESHTLLIGAVEAIRSEAVSRKLLYLDGAWASLVRASDADIDAFRKGIEVSIDALDDARSTLPDPQESLRTFVRTFARVNVERKESTRHFLAAEPYVSADRLAEINQARRAFTEKLEALLGEGVEQGAFDVKDIRLAALVIPGMVGWVGRAYNARRPGGADQVAALMADLIVRMFSPLPARSDECNPLSDRFGPRAVS